MATGQSKKREENIYDGKVVEFYASTVNAWYTTRFELDKALMTLASGAIGLFITLLSTESNQNTCTSFFFIAATTCFVATIVSILIIFKRNSTYLKNLIHDPNTKSDTLLRGLDWIAPVSFIFGIIFSAAIVWTLLIQIHPNGVNIMATTKESSTNSGTGTVKKSLDGAGGLQPSQPKQQQQTGKTNTGTSKNQGK